MIIKNGLVVDPALGLSEKMDLAIENGTILKIGKNIDTDAGYNACLFMFLTLHNEALRFRAWQNKTKYKPKKIEDIEFMLVLDDLKPISNAIKEAVYKSKKVDVETEASKN